VLQQIMFDASDYYLFELCLVVANLTNSERK